MPSAVIRRFAYEPASQVLTITFVSGRVYVYEDVPAKVSAAFDLALSKGTFFNARIRDRYRYREIAAVGS